MVPVFLTTLVIGLGMLAIQLFAGRPPTGAWRLVTTPTGTMAHGSSSRAFASGPSRCSPSGSWERCSAPLPLRGPNRGHGHRHAVVGLLAGYVASATVRRLQRQVTTSVITNEDVVGRVGRVLVVPTGEARGKVRVAVRGSVVDYVARSTTRSRRTSPSSSRNATRARSASSGPRRACTQRVIA